MDLSEAKYIAAGIVARLVPVTEQLLVCGSLRRERDEVGDIDIVLIPKRDQVKDLFGTVIERPVIPEFINVVNSWTKIIGEPTGKYTRRLLEGGHHLELTICDASTWPSLTLIRTGDAEFTRKMMIRALKLGFEQRDGYLWDSRGTKVPLTSEADYFRTLDLPYLHPRDRTAQAYADR